MTLEYRRRSDDELRSLHRQMQRGEVVSSLQIAILGVDPGSEAHQAMLRRTIAQMFPMIGSAPRWQRELMMQHRAAVYYAEAQHANVQDGDGIPVFGRVDWLSDEDLRRMWALIGAERFDALPQHEIDGEGEGQRKTGSGDR